MATFMKLLGYSVREAQVTLFALDAGFCGVEWQVLLINPITSKLTDISI